ncbi:MAG: hypothetical protein LBJ62_09685 [Bifidobacteriaceae bacterium]|jgi:hypothetical protein|nr:hypothetical protein [Bifidobacteriaceae bacterium]
MASHPTHPKRWHKPPLSAAAVTLAVGWLAAAAPAAQAEIVVDTCPSGQICIAENRIVVSDHLLDTYLQLDPEGDLIVDPGVTLTLAQGASFSDFDRFVNNGTVVVQGQSSIEARLVNNGSFLIGSQLDLSSSIENLGSMEIVAGGSVTTDASRWENSGNITIQPGAEFTSTETSLLNTGSITNHGTMSFSQHPFLQDFDFLNQGTVDNTAGLVYLDYAKVTGQGTWLGTAEHAPLYSFRVDSFGFETGQDYDLIDCLPVVSGLDQLGPWARYSAVDSQVEAYAYQGITVGVTAPESCVSQAGPMVFGFWGLGGDGAFAAIAYLTNPFTVTTDDLTLRVGIYYQFPQAEPSPSPSLAPTGPASGTAHLQGVAAVLLIMAGAALVVLGLRRRRLAGQSSEGVG